MIDYHDVGGCYILRPWAYSIWERVQSHLDAQFKRTGVDNGTLPFGPRGPRVIPLDLPYVGPQMTLCLFAYASS